MSDGGSFKLHFRSDLQPLKSEINQASDFNADEKVLTRVFFTFPGIFLQSIKVEKQQSKQWEQRWLWGLWLPSQNEDSP